MGKQASNIIDIFQQKFALMERQLNGATNSEAHMARKSAFKNFKSKGLPGRKDEEYRYTPLAKELELAFAGYSGNPTQKSEINKSIIPDLDGLIICFVNGVYNTDLSTTTKIKGLDIQIAGSEKDLIHSELTYSSTSTDVYSGLNIALAASGVKLVVENGVVIEQPVHIINITDTKNGRVFITPRHEFKLGNNAQLTIGEIFIGLGEAASFTNSVVESKIGESSVLNHFKIGLDVASSLRIDNTTCHQLANSVINTVSVNYGGKIIRNNLNILLDGEHCEANLAGLYLPGNGGIIDSHSVVDHKMPNSNSNELYKGIMGENAVGVFNGKVFVRPDAQKTNAFQSNKNILLSDTATINTKPQLEIWADDVKCSHGCTTGQMDKEQLFYLRARGIDEGMAKKLLLRAFSEEIIEKIKDDKLRARVSAVLETQLEQ